MVKWLVGLGMVMMAVVAEAGVCPDPATLPMDQAALGLCSECTSPAGPIAWCPVTEIWNGSLGCSCQSASNVIRCQDPNVSLCGPVSVCPALDVCGTYTLTHCRAAGTDIPAYVPQCYFTGTVIPNPAVCSCQTTMVRQPLTLAQKALYSTYAGAYGTCAAAFQGLSLAQFPPFTWVTTRWLARACAITASAMAVMANDPPDVTYDDRPPLVMITDLPMVSVADQCDLAICNTLNSAFNKLNMMQGKMARAAEGLNRFSGAVQDDAGPWADQQIAWAQDAVSGAQTAAGLAALHLQTIMNHPTMWRSYDGLIDLRPAVIGLVGTLQGTSTGALQLQ